MPDNILTGEKAKLSIQQQKQNMTPFQKELKLEEELLRNIKIYKNMERDKNIQSKGKRFTKQTDLIKILKKENRNILNDLNVATGSSNVKKNAAIWKKLLVMLEDYDKVNKDIKRERNILDEIEYQIKRTANKVIELQAKQITDLQHQTRVLEGQKTVEKLENRLATMNRAFCTILEQNRKLREEIEHYLLERTYFNTLWEVYIRKLNIGKKIMMDLIEQATIAYDQREEWVQNLQALRARATNDFTIHITEMSHLQTEIMHSKKLEEFLEIKNQKRLMIDLEDRLMKKRRENKERIQQQVEEYEKLLEEIREFTGEKDMHLLGVKFLHAEEENFAKYLYTNELTMEMEEMSRKLNHYRKLADAERDKNDRDEKHEKETIEQLNNELKDAAANADAAELQYKKTSDKLNDLLKGIEKLFKICKCSNAPILELLGNNVSLTKYNALLYLNVLEQRACEMLRNICFRQKYDRKIKTQIVMDRIKKTEPELILNKANTSPCPLCMETAFCADIIEKVVLPLAKDQVETKLNNYLAIPDAVDLVHNVSACHLPKSRQIIQKRYQ